MEDYIKYINNMNNQNHYEEEIKRIIKDYVETERKNGKKIDEINPWKIFENQRLIITKMNNDGSVFVNSLQGGVLELMIIESSLHDAYGDKDYFEYINNNSQEKKWEEILINKAKITINKFLESKQKDKIKVEVMILAWLEMIEKHWQYLSLTLFREKDGKSLVLSRKKDDLKDVFVQQCKNFDLI